MIGDSRNNSFGSAGLQVRKDENDGDFFLQICQGSGIFSKTNSLHH